MYIMFATLTSFVFIQVHYVLFHYQGLEGYISSGLYVSNDSVMCMVVTIDRLWVGNWIYWTL
jgi:hypothetical protein